MLTKRLVATRESMGARPGAAIRAITAAVVKKANELKERIGNILRKNSGGLTGDYQKFSLVPTFLVGWIRDVATGSHSCEGPRVRS